MISVVIHVLTTEGASRLVYLGKEDADSGVASAIRVDGETRPLTISRDYGDFLDTFVQRFSKHRVYRADVSKRIDAGRSWYLGFLLAHWVLEQPGFRLAVEDETADVAVFVSGGLRDRPGAGTVDVAPVDDIETKVLAARTDIEEAHTRGQQVVVFVPAGNRGPFLAALRRHPLPEGSTALCCGVFDEVLDAVAGHPDALAASLGRPADAQRTRVHRMIAVVGAVCALAALGVYGLSELPDRGRDRPGPQAALDVATETASRTEVDVRLTIEAVRPADDRSCSGNRFRQAGETIASVGEPNAAEIVLQKADSVCALGFVLTNRDQGPVRAHFVLFGPGAVDGGAVALRQVRYETHLLEPGQTGRILHRLPRSRSAREEWQFAALAYRMPGAPERLDLSTPARLRQILQETANAGVAAHRRTIMRIQ